MMLNPSDGLPDDRKSLYPQSQSSAYKCGDKTSPISVILVSSGSRGNKLLFRYPYQKVAECPSSLSGRGSISMKQKHKHLRTHRCRFHVITYLQEIIKQQCNPGQTNSPFCCDCRLWNCGLSFFFFFFWGSGLLVLPSWSFPLGLSDCCWWMCHINLMYFCSFTSSSCCWCCTKKSLQLFLCVFYA